MLGYLEHIYGFTTHLPGAQLRPYAHARVPAVLHPTFNHQRMSGARRAWKSVSICSSERPAVSGIVQ